MVITEQDSRRKQRKKTEADQHKKKKKTYNTEKWKGMRR